MVQWNAASFWIIEQSHKKFALFKLLILQSFSAVGIENEYISYLLFIYIYVSVYLYFNKFMYMFMHSSWTTLFFNKQGKAEYYGKLKSLFFPILDSSLTLVLEPVSIIYIADDEVVFHKEWVSSHRTQRLGWLSITAHEESRWSRAEWPQPLWKAIDLSLLLWLEWGEPPFSGVICTWIAKSLIIKWSTQRRLWLWLQVN